MTGTGKEYAVALFELAAETENEESVWDGLCVVKDVFANTPDLAPFLRSPGIAESIRLKTVEDAFASQVPDEVLSFLGVLVKRGDVGLLSDCIAEYEALYNKKRRVARAVATSAVPLTDDEKRRLAEKLTALHGARVEIEYQVDPSLLGGLSVELDGTILDGTLKRRMKTIKEVMSQ